jgi:hypothetical protein
MLTMNSFSKLAPSFIRLGLLRYKAPVVVKGRCITVRSLFTPGWVTSLERTRAVGVAADRPTA